ncbi:ribokinase [Thermoanaerobacterium thermosaccharolyticum]|uniref:Ribokinase n=1 Tax=Thermoanaerobacterium thermosaccharolyticum (strain ATCC 7956 / DSM 571 / NCIMB 9385 / NCA 3814 / NCTC 13789 / WDCM 00135 / 2032) TaxID=580327 RepID=D9TQJ0_THETC|nr:ribokinase [Thermoanaerobacterium thermosaccharolyticum]ADL69224.1 ribokinase [Thermoanaerobacterium thermosaccharolyticum DSM 571]MBE0068682.1 ribokinase [Thermoanaerobacterium thermosaccharolyticum]MBE0228270.1 ribokinase [Thermoanaerobacterium thermosaccharolyticum]TCW31991.1 ribokinase [Thermohydrogenium kirishiense]
MKNILVVGSINMDIVIKVEHIPKIGETVIAKEVNYSFGGKGANQAVAIAKLGGNVTMIGRVGDDNFGKELIENLDKQKVKPSGIEIDKTEKTGMAFIYVSDKGENNISVNQGANKKLDVEQINRHLDLFDAAEICVLQLEIPIETVKYAIEICNKKNIKVILNPAPARKIPEEILKNIYILTPNESELSILTKKNVKTIEDINNASEILLESGVQNIITTLGEKGCFLKNKNDSLHFAAVQVDAIDTTAAGDSFTGAISIALNNGKSIKEAIEFATYVSALTVTKEGTQDSLPDKLEVEKFINERREVHEKNNFA